MTTTISPTAGSNLHEALQALAPQPYNLTSEQIAAIRERVTAWLDTACAQMSRELCIERDGVKVAHFGEGLVHILVGTEHEIFAAPVQTLRTLVEVGGELLARLDA